MKTLVLSVLLAAALAPAAVHAEETKSMKAECYERSNLLYSLATEFNERLDQARRVGKSGLLESFKSDEGTWTIVYSDDEGLSCVLAMGDGLASEEGETQKQVAELAI
jgi:hypothetical protein